MSASKSGAMDAKNKKGQDSQASCPESICNLSLLDPPRWGWTALGGIDDVLPPHERARRKASKAAYLRHKRKRRRSSDASHTSSRRGSATGAAASAAAFAAGNQGQLGSISETASDLVGGLNESGVMNVESAILEGNAVRFSAISPSGVLDVRAYHRGREGAELRAEGTGELLCDVEASDTNHTLDAPRLSATVVIQIPLDGGNNATTNEGASEGEGGQPKREMYTESLTWNLGSPQTPTPMQFATDVAQNFGLSFPQTLQLAESIEGQLRTFVNDNCSYAPPIALQSDAAQNRPQHCVPSLYGQATGDLDEGHCRVVSQKCRAVSRSSSGILRPPTTEKLVSKGTAPAKRKRESISVREQVVERVFKEEVFKRLRMSSETEIKEKWASTDRTTTFGEIAQIEDGKCHLCQRQGGCGGFACGIDGHAYCLEHLRSFFDSLQVKPVPGAVALSFCPVCTLSCGCSNCSKRLDACSAELKKESLKQGVPPELTTFANLINRAKGIPAKGSQKKRGRWAKKRDLDARPRVAKVPGSEFPREVFNGVDIDPGTDSLYSTVYTKDGAFVERTPGSTDLVPPPLNETKANDGAVVAEDGSVDFCLICRKPGNLVCCDYCPRAFHGACVPPDKLSANEEKWECPSCRNEKAGLPNDKLDGSKYLEMVSSALELSGKEGGADLAKVVSILYEMTVVLREYDFGYLFQIPVDTTQIPTYKTIVSHPMDLGTIATKISEGVYKAESDDDVVLAILKDIELVWHNCFLFNREGSTVYRMAEVQRRRALSIRKQSFDSLLSDEVKRLLEEYIEACSKKRQSEAQSQKRASPAPPRHSNRPQPRHKITATSAGINGRPIAVFDQDSGKVVKIYRTMKCVVGVLDMFFNLKHPCEWERKEVDSQAKIRKLIIESTTDPRIRLFGYRWIFLDDLENQKISLVFKELAETRKDAPPRIKNGARVGKQAVAGVPRSQAKVREIVEVSVAGGICVVFGSLEVALTYGDLHEDDRKALREHFEKYSSEPELAVQFGPMKWQRVLFAEGQQNGHLPGDEWDISRLPGIIVVKRDTISNAVLVGFRRMEDAYEDWTRSIQTLVSSNGVAGSMDLFRQGFLDGTHNVDGVEYLRVGAATNEPDIPTNSVVNSCDDGSASRQQQSMVNGGNSVAADNGTSTEVVQKPDEDGGVAAQTVPEDGVATSQTAHDNSGDFGKTGPDDDGANTQNLSNS